jgi:hypothetical protein
MKARYLLVVAAMLGGYLLGSACWRGNRCTCPDLPPIGRGTFPITDTDAYGNKVDKPFSGTVTISDEAVVIRYREGQGPQIQARYRVRKE